MNEHDGRDGRKIAALLDVMHEHDLDALTVRVGEETLEVVRRQPAALVVPTTAEAEDVAAVPPGTAAPASAIKIAAPIVGVFYRAASPGSDPYVEVGDAVEAGQVLCILEAMKLMNEITSDVAGTVRRILPENGALVSLGDDLVWIDP